MSKEAFEIAENVYKVVKYMNLIQRCEYYIDAIKSGFASVDIIKEAERFNTYEELKKEDEIIAAVNTCNVTRNIDSVSNLDLNWRALLTMLRELRIKEGYEVNDKLMKRNNYYI